MLKLSVIRFPVVFSVVLAFTLIATWANAHGVDENTRAFLDGHQGVQFIPFVYIGAKHMLTGYDHLLFLFGVLFFLYRLRDVFILVSLFTIGHSITLLFGVLANIGVNAYLIDAVIGFSVFYKAFDNLGGLEKLFNWRPNVKLVVFLFGLIHGFGLATKLQDFHLPSEGLLTNLLAFNIGVEIGQISALFFIFILINAWRHSASFMRFSTVANTLLMSAGITLTAYQLLGYWVSL